MTTGHKRMSLTIQILLALGLGGATGIGLNLLGMGVPGTSPAWINQYVIEGLFAGGGDIFVRALKLMVVPLVFVSLVNGTMQLEDVRKMGRIGIKTFVLYLLTTALATALAIFFAVLIGPGKGVELVMDSSFSIKSGKSLYDVFVGLVPTNPVQALAEGDMLQIIVFSILLGMSVTLVGSKGAKVREFFESLNEVVMQLVMIVMSLAPIGVFCLVGKTFATQKFELIWALMGYFMTVMFVLFVHMLVTYPTLLAVLGRLNPVRFFINMKNVIPFAFSTASSSATLPVTLESVEHKMGVDNRIASFTIPLGATVNMDGTAIMQGVATVFVAQVYDVHLGLGGYLTVILMATLASIGTAGVPSAGLVMLVMVFEQVGLPVEAIGAILGIDRLLDMTRTAVNVCGDAAVTAIVAKSENQINLEIYNANN